MQIINSLKSHFVQNVQRSALALLVLSIAVTKVSAQSDRIGYRDLTFGSDINFISSICELKSTDNFVTYLRATSHASLISFECYEDEDLTLMFTFDLGIFEPEFETSAKVEGIFVDVGPLHLGIRDIFFESEDNPYVELRNILRERYGEDWEFSDRQRLAFNDGDGHALYSSFANGQVFLTIFRHEQRLHLGVEYNQPEEGLTLSRDRQPRDLDTSRF